jgi:phosphate starvation-inducible PhoH-like protein
MKKPDPIKPLNRTQAVYVSSINRNILTFGIGPAGTGKTYVAAAKASEAIMNKSKQKIIITRPVVEAGESLGFLPGELEEKFDPYFAPVKKVFEKFLGKGRLGYCIKNKIIEVMPIAYMRGHSFDDCFVIFDEAQNATATQMKLFLTRIGENTTAVVNGDLNQRDIEYADGLEDAMARVGGLYGVETVHFTQEDVVRSGFVQSVVRAYENIAAHDTIIHEWRPPAISQPSLITS